MSHFGRFSHFVARTVTGTIAPWAVAGLMGLGCTGQVASRSGEGDDPTPGAGGKHTGSGGSAGHVAGDGGQGGVVDPPVGPGDPGRAVFRRLSRLEYNNTVRDLLGDSSAPASAFPPDSDPGKSGFVAGGVVAHTDASRLLDAAEALSRTAMGKLAMLLPCGAMPAAAPDQDTCAGQFITQFGKRAFRRPLTTEETADLTAFYKSQRSAGTDFPNSMRLLIAAVLMSPQFLYRWEVTPETVVRDGNLLRFNSYEMASRLSYLFWASMPDNDGFAKADKDGLSTPDQIEAEARRLLASDKAKQSISELFTQWLGVSDLRSAPKDPGAFPLFTPELADAMAAETAMFSADVVVKGDGKLSTIFTSSNSFVDANLAKLYGLTTVTSTTPVATALPAAQRAGILTHASFLTQHANSDETNPARRGKVIADRVICADIPPPPDNVPDPDKPMQGVSVRQRFAKHSTNPCAASCHTTIDPLGFAFENYNGIGAYQTTDLGRDVDASGTINLDGKDHPFKNAIEFQALLGQSAQVADCMAKQVLRYALRRHEEDSEEGALAEAAATFAAKSYNLRELMVALTRTRAFTHRTPSTGEVIQ
jgi:hypothetical protein